jgi:hypothetical protein
LQTSSTIPAVLWTCCKTKWGCDKRFYSAMLRSLLLQMSTKNESRHRIRVTVRSYKVGTYVLENHKFSRGSSVKALGPNIYSRWLLRAADCAMGDKSLVKSDKKMSANIDSHFGLFSRFWQNRTLGGNKIDHI